MLPGFQQKTRDTIPGWDGLLFVYGIILIPVLLLLLIGINLLAWSHSLTYKLRLYIWCMLVYHVHYHSEIRDH
jgi:hypothetical protein